MKFGIALVVHDPLDRFSAACALPETLASIESLQGDRQLVVSVNRSAHCPSTAAFVHSWAATRGWVTVVEAENVDGAAASFNMAVGTRLDECDAWMFASSDALFTDQQLLVTLGEAFDRWPTVGAIHPLSTFEDADFANASRERDLAAFLRFLHSPQNAASPIDDVTDPTADGISQLNDDVVSRPLSVGRARRVLPLTAQAMRTSMLRAIGLLDDRWQAGFENMDLALRAYHAGYSSVMLNNAFVYHRRPLFRLLGSYATVPSTPTTQTDLIAGSYDAWLDKWGSTPEMCWDSARYGTMAARLMAPGRRAVPRARKRVLAFRSQR